MKLLTIGIGVIGTTYSWQLQKTGVMVTHYVRKEKIDNLRINGLPIRCLDMRKQQGQVYEEIYRPDFIDTFSSDHQYDYILVSVNSYQLKDVLSLLKDNVGKGTIIFLQNMRMGEDKLIEQFLDKSQYVLAYPFKAGGGLVNGWLETVIFGFSFSNTVIGEVDGVLTNRILKIKELFKSAQMNPQITKLIIPYIRTHYIWASCSEAAYIQAGSYEKFLSSKIIKESYLAMREGWEICKRQGINPKSVSPTCFYYLPLFLLVPVTQWLYKKRGMQEMVEGHIKHSPKEVIDMYYTIQALGEMYQINMPCFNGYKKNIEAFNI